MRARAGELCGEAREPDQHLAHRRDRVDAQVGARAVRRDAGRLDVEPDEPLVRDAHVEPGRLGHDRGVGRELGGDPLGADRLVLLVAHGRHDHVAAQAGAAGRRGCGHDRGQPALHVERPAPVHAPVLDPRLEGRVHPLDADDVHVRAEEERAAAATPAGGRDRVGAAGRDLLDAGVQAALAHPAGRERGDLGLAGAAGHELRVDRVDLDQPRQKLGGLAHAAAASRAIAGRPGSGAAPGCRMCASWATPSARRGAGRE